MGSEWKEYSLEEVTELIIDCPHSTPKWTEEGVVVLRNQNIRNGKLDLTSPSFTNEKGYKDRIKRAIPKEDDLVFTREAPMGEVCKVPKGLRCCLGQRMVLLRADKNKIDPTFLLYEMQSPNLKHQISWNEGTGTTVSNIRIPNIKAFKINVPPLHEQKTIAHILGSLDDKIELNRQMNQTLEQMAQALFKSWFVDFDPVIDNALAAGNEIPEPLEKRAQLRKELGDARKALPENIQQLFPAEFEFSEELDKWVPRGWKATFVNELVESISETYPLKKVEKVIFLNTGDILDGQFLHENYSEIKSLPGQAKKSIKKGDILFSEIRPQNKRYAYVNFDGKEHVVSTKLMVLRAIGSVSSIFTYFFLKQQASIDYLQLMAETRSGTFPQITFDVLSTITLALPNDDTLITYFSDSLLSLYFDKIEQNNAENESLTKLRDTFLPKLVSGEVRVPEDQSLNA